MQNTIVTRRPRCADHCGRGADYDFDGLMLCWIDAQRIAKGTPVKVIITQEMADRGLTSHL